MTKYIYTCLALLGIVLSQQHLFAQKDTVNYRISLSGISSNGNFAPFWFHSNQYDAYSAQPNSTTLSCFVGKEFNKQVNKADYAYGVEVAEKADRTTARPLLLQYYAKVRYQSINLIVGAHKEIYGNQDSTLSMGNILLSSNARPIPEIYAGIPSYTPVPFTKGYFEIKGGLAHGWFTDNIGTKNVYYHHKYMYARIGGKLPVHIEGGLEHVAQWGGNLPGFGQQPTSFRDYINVFFIKAGGTGGEYINKYGNHILSQSVGLNLDINKFTIRCYWQNISEDGPVRIIYNTMNKDDGLWGVAIRNKQFPVVHAILFEYLNTTDQSGPYHDKDGVVYGGSDNYFINYMYQSGWSFYSRTIGTAFISSPLYNKSSVCTENSRVQVYHCGIEGQILGVDYKCLNSFSRNYGSYSSPINAKNNTFIIQMSKNIPRLHHINLAVSLATDRGNLYGNSTGLMVSVSKKGNLFSY